MEIAITYRVPLVETIICCCAGKILKRHVKLTVYVCVCVWGLKNPLEA